MSPFLAASAMLPVSEGVPGPVGQATGPPGAQLTDDPLRVRCAAGSGGMLVLSRLRTRRVP